MATEGYDDWELKETLENTPGEAGEKMEEAASSMDNTENIQLQSVPAGTLKKLKVSNQAIIERLCREELEVVALMHKEQFKGNDGFESLAMSVQSVSQDLMRARGMMRFCCQLVFEVMRYKSATVEEDNAMWKAISAQSLNIIQMAKSVFAKGVEYFGYLLRLRDSVIYCVETQRGDNPMSPERSLAQLKKDTKDFTEFAQQCRTELARLDEKCMEGIQDCLENNIGDKSVDIPLLKKLREEYEEKLAWLSKKRFELWQKREEASAEYVAQLKELQRELRELETQVAREMSKKAVCQAKLMYSEQKVQNMQEAAKESTVSYKELQEKVANAKDVEVVSDQNWSRRTYYFRRWWLWDSGHRSDSKTKKSIRTGEREALHKLAQERKEAMDEERHRLENVEQSREKWKQELEDTKARLKTANIKKKEKQEEVKKVSKQIDDVEQPYVDEEAEAVKTVNAAKTLLDQEHEAIQKACSDTKVATGNLADFLILFNSLGPCAQAMSAKMVQFDGQIQNMEELLSKRLASNNVEQIEATLESKLTGKLKPFLTCLQDEDIDTLDDFKCESKEEFEEDYLPILEEYAKDKGIKFTKGLQMKLRKIAMHKEDKADEAAKAEMRKHYEVTLKGLTALPEFFYGMYQGLSRSCNQLSLESYDESDDNLRAIKQ